MIGVIATVWLGISTGRIVVNIFVLRFVYNETTFFMMNYPFLFIVIKNIPYLIYNLSIQATTNDYSLDGSLIPRSFKGYCSSNKIYRDRFRTCSCDTHCSWDLCRSFTPPTDCLLGTDSVWKVDNVKNAWVAQRLGGNASILSYNFYWYASFIPKITYSYIYVLWYVFKH